MPPNDGMERKDKLTLLAAAFFAVRLFRDVPGPTQPERELEAKRAALDADALLKAVEALP